VSLYSLEVFIPPMSKEEAISWIDRIQVALPEPGNFMVPKHYAPAADILYTLRRVVKALEGVELK
jgi:hypothetical protein